MNDMTLSEEKRYEILAELPQRVLYPQILGKLDIALMEALESILESKLDTFAHLSDDPHDFHNDELVSAVVTEVVYSFDRQTVEGLIFSATSVATLDFAATGDNVMERIGVVIDSIVDFFPEDKTGTEFIIASPMIIAMMQSHKDSTYTPAIEGSFEGLGNTMLVGELDSIRVYSFLFDINTGIDVVAGYKLGEELNHKKFRITNMSFAP